MDIATGQPESHPTPLPYDPSAVPAVAGLSMTAGQLSPADQGGVFDATAYQADRLGGYEQDMADAQASGAASEHDRRAHYAADMLPVGASYGDAVDLPVVPEDASAPSNDFLFAQGDQPGRGT